MVGRKNRAELSAAHGQDLEACRYATLCCGVDLLEICECNGLENSAISRHAPQPGRIHRLNAECLISHTLEDIGSYKAGVGRVH